MAPDDLFEQRLQAVLDGRPLPPGDPDDVPVPLTTSLNVVDAIGRAHRIAIFGYDASLDAPPVTHWGHLEVRGEIGRGASGTVHRAWDPRLAREVALKLLDSDRATDEEALEEGRLLARLNHPHIVRVFGAAIHDGKSGIWMEMLEGDTLDEILARDGVFGAEETLLIGLDLSRALSAVHAAGLLHRDIKARNVLRERGGRVVLMDLGAGRTTDRASGASDGAGTPMYMAPEVLAGGEATVRSDLYCLGVLLFRLLSRSYPVTAGDLQQLRSAHAGGRRTTLGGSRPDLYREIVDVIERACDPDPSARFASAAELEEALASVLQRAVSHSMVVAGPLVRTIARWKITALTTALTAGAVLLTTWISWDAIPVRSARRALGFTVPPKSVLYVSMQGALGIVRSGRLSVVAHNPTTALAIVASSDLGVLTVASVPPFTEGAAYRLDGTAVAAPPTINQGLCCLSDGTTDGRFNYAARQDSTLLEPIGSRPLAPPALYRFNRDWSSPELLFRLAPEGLYGGVGYDASSDSFWLTNWTNGASIIEQWSRDGRLVSSPVTLQATNLSGLAVDPADGTLWVVGQHLAAGSERLENFDRSGRRLASLRIESPSPGIHAIGAEFVWTRQH